MEEQRVLQAAALEDEFENVQNDIVDEEKELMMLRLGLALELDRTAEKIFSVELSLERQRE